jgi:hypothetical protein
VLSLGVFSYKNGEFFCMIFFTQLNTGAGRLACWGRGAHSPTKAMVLTQISNHLQKFPSFSNNFQVFPIISNFF